MAQTMRERDAAKPNSAARKRYRESFAPNCGTCDEPLDWTEAAYNAKSPARGTIGHIVADCIGGTYGVNTFGQCWPCNNDAKVAGVFDLTNDVFAWARIERVIPASVVADRERKGIDVRSMATLTGVATVEERRRKRHSFGIVW